MKKYNFAIYCGSEALIEEDFEFDDNITDEELNTAYGEWWGDNLNGYVSGGWQLIE